MAKRTPRADKTMRFTCVIRREGRWFVAECPEIDVASQGESVEKARENLQEALQLFIEHATPTELRRRQRGEVYVTPIDVSIGKRAG